MSLFKFLLVLIMGIIIGVIGTDMSKYSVSKAMAICLDKTIKEKNTLSESDVQYYYQLPANLRITYGMAEGYINNKIVHCLIGNRYE